MNRIAAVLFSLMCCQAAAAQSCDVFLQLMSEKNVPVLNKREATCSTSKVLGAGPSTDCYWVFDYRAEEALLVFRKLADDLKSCADDGVQTNATSVNHPDSFDQITGEINGHGVSVSLKDKGALSQTLIFLRAAEP